MSLFCFLLVLLCTHCVYAAIEENITRKFEETRYGKSTNSVSSTAATNDHFADKIGHEATRPSTNGFMNWTKEDLTNLLEQHGYLVKKDSEGWPLGVMGDVVYYPEDLLPEMGMLQNRRNLLDTKSLWVDGNKETIVPYYYDTGSKADQKVFETAVRSWSDHTCIKFAKQPPNHCKADLGQAAVCVGNFGGCWSKLGRKYAPNMKHSQQMSVQPSGCEEAAAAHEFGHALGLCHEMARADREQHIHVLYRNIDLDLNKLTNKDIAGAWFQGAQCSAEQMYDAPKPYDPMSMMQYGTSDFAMEDQRPVYLHKNPHYQYMFDYHRLAGYLLTHYDKLVMNLGYKCVPKWKKSCENSGRSVPKCQNYGYVGKDCKCACHKGFSGSTCGTKEGPMFPLMDRAKAMLDITKPGLVDVKGKGMHDENHNYPKASFTKWQFMAVIIRSGEKTRISVDVAQNFDSIKRYFARSQAQWMENGQYECQYGIRVYVGHSEAGKIRTECISSMVNNEPKEYRTVLRSRSNALDIMGVGGWAAGYSGGPPVTRMAMEFQFTVSFLDRPEDKLSTEQKNPGKVREAVGETMKGAKKAMQKALGENTSILIVVVLVLLVCGSGGGAYWWYSKSKTSDGEDLKPRKIDHSSNDTDSDSSD